MLEQSPLCFGAITFYAADSDKCSVCPFAGDCGEKVKQHIAEVSRIIDVDDLMLRHKAYRRKGGAQSLIPDTGRLNTQAPAAEREMTVATATITPADGGVVVDVRTEAKSILTHMLRVGSLDEIRESLRTGSNPFPASMTREHILAELLIKGPATIDGIRKAVAPHVRDPEATTKALMVSFVGSKVAKPAGEHAIEVNQ